MVQNWNNKKIREGRKCRSDKNGRNGSWYHVKSPVEGYIHVSLLAKPGYTSPALEINELSYIELEDLFWRWIYKSEAVTLVGHSMLIFDFSDSPESYNGQRLSYQRRGGRHIKVLKTPVTWDLSDDGTTIGMQQWTEVNEKGTRQYWEVHWYIEGWNPVVGELRVREILVGVDGFSIRALKKCGTKNIGQLKQFCDSK